jgi:hypothetical protein
MIWRSKKTGNDKLSAELQQVVDYVGEAEAAALSADSRIAEMVAEAEPHQPKSHDRGGFTPA